MPITFRHDAAAVATPSNQAQRKYGQSLVLQQNQQKYQAQQAGYDRLFQLGRDVQENQNQFARDVRQNFFEGVRQREQNNFVLGRDKAQAEQQMQQQEAARQQAFMEDARKQSGGMIMQDIQNGEYDPVTARKLQQSLVAESEALGNPGLDATQRAEALQKIRAERAMLTANRLQKPPPPTRDEELQKFLGAEGYATHGNLPWVPDGKGGFSVSKEALAAQQQEQQRQQQEAERMRPKSAQDYYNDPANKGQYQKDLDATMKRLEDARATDAKAPEPTEANAWAEMQRRYDIQQQQLGRPQYGNPTAAPELAAGAAPAVPGASQSILETPTAALPDAGQPPAPLMAARPDPGMPPSPAPGQQAGAPMLAQRPDPGMPPAPAREPMPLTANSSSRNPVGALPPAAPQPQQVKVGGKPLVVTPGTLTPQETAARQQIMEMPREQRIAMLMPYDPELKGRTIDEILEDPKTKAGYEELSKEGLTTGNYREDMLAQMDEQLRRNVLERAGTPPDAYVGMRADDITDPKGKAEVAKMPRPKTEDEIKALRVPFFIDPAGIIRSTKKQA